MVEETVVVVVVKTMLVALLVIVVEAAVRRDVVVVVRVDVVVKVLVFCGAKMVNVLLAVDVIVMTGMTTNNFLQTTLLGYVACFGPDVGKLNSVVVFAVRFRKGLSTT